MKLVKLLSALLLLSSFSIIAQTDETAGDKPAKVKFMFQSVHQAGTNIFDMQKVWAESIPEITGRIQV